MAKLIPLEYAEVLARYSPVEEANKRLAELIQLKRQLEESKLRQQWYDLQKQFLLAKYSGGITSPALNKQKVLKAFRTARTAINRRANDLDPEKTKTIPEIVKENMGEFRTVLASVLQSAGLPAEIVNFLSPEDYEAITQGKGTIIWDKIERRLQQAQKQSQSQVQPQPQEPVIPEEMREKAVQLAKEYINKKPNASKEEIKQYIIKNLTKPTKKEKKKEQTTQQPQTYLSPIGAIGAGMSNLWR